MLLGTTTGRKDGCFEDAHAGDVFLLLSNGYETFYGVTVPLLGVRILAVVPSRI